MITELADDRDNFRRQLNEAQQMMKELKEKVLESKFGEFHELIQHTNEIARHKGATGHVRDKVLKLRELNAELDHTKEALSDCQQHTNKLLQQMKGVDTSCGQYKKQLEKAFAQLRECNIASNQCVSQRQKLSNDLSKCQDRNSRMMEASRKMRGTLKDATTNN